MHGLAFDHHGGSACSELSANVSHAPLVRRGPTVATRRTGATTSGSFKK